MAKFVGGTGGTVAAADYLAGDDFDAEWDPRSSDFASIQAGNTTFDMMGGLRPLINAGSRIATASGKSAKEDEEVYPLSRGDTSMRFIRSKLGPGIPSMAGDFLLGNDKRGVTKDLTGQPIEEGYKSGPFEDIPYLPWLANQVSPMYPGDIYEAFEESGPAVGTAAAGLGMLGAGTSSYDRSSKRWKKNP
jgi:hypothetical protein